MPITASIPAKTGPYLHIAERHDAQADINKPFIILRSGSRTAIIDDEDLCQRDPDGSLRVYQGELALVHVLDNWQSGRLDVTWITAPFARAIHNEANPAASVQAWQTVVREQAQVMHTSAAIDETLPENSICFVPGPQRDLSNEEYLFLEQWIRSGGHVVSRP